MALASLICATLASCVVLTLPASAKECRSAWVKREVQLTHPCPSTGQKTGPCPGYVKDHIVPLACGGPPGQRQAEASAGRGTGILEI